MTESEWLVGTHPLRMLRSVGHTLSDRKLRLFGCACCRHIWDSLEDERSRFAVEVSERYADGLADQDELEAAMRAAREADARGSGVAKQGALQAARAGLEAALSVTGSLRSEEMWPAARDARQQERIYQAALLRDIFGNPFRTMTVAPSWLSWNNGCVVKVAQSIYDERHFANLPVLADALLDAGCDSEAILAHCCSPGPHVRGCRVVDLLLAKG
jgi:hypothetical protein